MEEAEETSIQERIAHVDAMIKQMKKTNDEMFEKFGISAHQLHHYLHDPERCSPEEKKAVDHICDDLERALQERIDAENQKAQSGRHPSPMDIKKGGHWICLH